MGDSRFYEYEIYPELRVRVFISYIRQISLDSEVTTHFVNEAVQSTAASSTERA